MAKQHVPPSRLRYQASHPTITVRVSKDLYDELGELLALSGKSLGDVVREALKKQKPSANRAYERGYEDGVEEWSVSYPCSRCGREMRVFSDGEKAVIHQALKTWHHEKCPR